MTTIYTTQFKKDFKRIQKRNYDIDELWKIIGKIRKREKLDPKHKNHKLKGRLKECRECHIKPNWLLIYWIKGQELILERTGTHRDLFK